MILTKKQELVLSLRCKGRNIKQIEQRMQISHSAVYLHLNCLFKIFNVKDSVELVAKVLNEQIEKLSNTLPEINHNEEPKQ